MKLPVVYRIASFGELARALRRIPKINRRYIILAGTGGDDYSAVFESEEFYKLGESDGSVDVVALEQGYSDLIANISSRNYCLSWWATTLSEKNEHSSLLYQSLVAYVLFCRALERCTGEENILLICNQQLADQVSAFCRGKSGVFFNCGNKLARFTERFVKWCKRIVRPAIFCLTVWGRIYYVRRNIGRKVSVAVSFLASKPVYVIRSFIDERIENYDSLTFNPYFGHLPKYVSDQGFQPLIFASIAGKFNNVIQILKKRISTIVIPEEYFLEWTDAFRSLLIAGESTKLDLSTQFCGLDVSILLTAELNSSNGSMATSRNALVYYAGHRFATAINFNVYIQTYENYAWEKMMFLGMRAAGSRALLLGFQHAFICQSSFKYFLGRVEKNLVPLPDRIIALGSCTKNMLEVRGNYPPNLLTVGCALRQEYLQHQLSLKRCKQKCLTVPLTMIISECQKIVHFVLDSGLANDWQINFRCHPSLPFLSFKAGLDQVIPAKITFNNELSVYDELAKSGVLAYTWSTVAAEALYLGIPVVHLDILQPLRVDPLFECADLKRVVRAPNDLVSAVRELYDMDDVIFENERKSARRYLEEYFYPVTDKNLRPFFATN